MSAPSENKNGIYFNLKTLRTNWNPTTRICSFIYVILETEVSMESWNSRVWIKTFALFFPNVNVVKLVKLLIDELSVLPYWSFWNDKSLKHMLEPILNKPRYQNVISQIKSKSDWEFLLSVFIAKVCEIRSCSNDVWVNEICYSNLPHTQKSLDCNLIADW